MTTKTRYLLTLFCFACALLMAPLARAANTPEDVCRAYLSAIKEHGMTATVDYFHPDELKRFKDMLMPFVNAARPRDIEPIFGEDATPDAIAALPPATFMRTFLQNIEGQMLNGVHFDSTEILGTVKEGAVRHIVTRLKLSAGPLTRTQLEVISLKPYGQTWRLLLSGQFEGIAQAMKAYNDGPN